MTEPTVQPGGSSASESEVPEASLAPTGRSFAIRWGTQRAVVTEQGAGLHHFEVDGRELLDTFPDRSIPHGGYGQILSPWPNRLAEGRYRFGGAIHQAVITEPATGSAIHGLVRWMTWQVREQQEASITLGLRLYAQPGYPFVLDLEQRYALSDAGLEVRHRATNLGSDPAPYGFGQHPYFSVGDNPIDPDVLEIPAGAYFEVDAGMIPRGDPVAVSGTPWDFNRPRALGDTSLDVGYAALRRDADGLARARLTGPTGRPAVTVAVDESHPYLQVFTGDSLGAPAARRGLAIEPYTCATNAFNNGLGLWTLEPGEARSASFWVSAEV